MPQLRLADGREVNIHQLEGHYMDKEIDFSLDGKFIGGNKTDYGEALADAVEGVEQLLGQKVVEYRDQGGKGWQPWPPDE
jgi:hypothetical protein